MHNILTCSFRQAFPNSWQRRAELTIKWLFIWYILGNYNGYCVLNLTIHLNLFNRLHSIAIFASSARATIALQ